MSRRDVDLLVTSSCGCRVDGRERARRALERAGYADRVRELEGSARTAAAAAAALGCDVGAIGNSLVFTADGAPVLVLTSGAHRVDLARAAARLGATELRRSTPDEVREATGCTLGGVAPVGHLQPLSVLVDLDLARTSGSGSPQGTRTPSSGPRSRSCWS